jgi:hypothetical protein
MLRLRVAETRMGNSGYRTFLRKPSGHFDVQAQRLPCIKSGRK